MNLKQRLIADWRWVLTHSWSVRLLVLSAALSGGEVLLPLLVDHVPHHLFMILTPTVTMAALIARFTLQNRQADQQRAGTDGS